MGKMSSKHESNTHKTYLDLDQFWEYIEWIELFDALEIHGIFREKASQNLIDESTNSSPGEEMQIDLLIPYLMNDCVESIITIHNCIFSSPLPMNSTTDDNSPYEDPLSDESLSDSKSRFSKRKPTDVETFLIKDAYFLDIEGTDDLILHLPEQIISLRYDHISIETHCYRYHDIGHNWRKNPGEEHIRRLVNLICIIYDKYRYLGEEYTNEIELALAPLIEFAPFAEWSPINSSMLEWYSESSDGIQAMKQIALDAGDSEYYNLLCEYERMPLTSSQRKMQSRILSSNLLHPTHASLYQTILDKITEASSMWEIRKYEPEQALMIQTYRENVIAHYQSLGYEGTYPHLKKHEKIGDSHQDSSESSHKENWTFITFVEQHPFTKLESKGYLFKIFAMETTGPDPCPPYDDYGFFHDVSEIGWSGYFYEIWGQTPFAL